MADDDSFFYLGTTTGDILKMNPKTKLLADTGPAQLPARASRDTWARTGAPLAGQFS